MLFHSLPFLVLLAVTFALYWSVHRVRALRVGVLLVSSLLFYAAWTPFPLLIFITYAAVNSVAAWVLDRVQRRWLRRAVLTSAVTLLLGGLLLFKYGDLFVKTGNWFAQSLGFGVRVEPPGLLLPIGLSFVAFQAISYIVDVYRGEVRGGRNFFDQCLYLLFFPQVIAGPIVRSSDLLERFDVVPSLAPEEGVRALFRIGMGIAKKMLIADVLSVGIVDPVFGQPELYSSAEVAVAIVAYTFQIYFDFSAYSDIAIGASALFGFPLPENFNKPYQAKNLFEFWNRWHISLSTWLRDYLYIPLGGNRGSKAQTLRNLMIVMVLGGLWHGASWRFAVWGLIHGVLLVAIRLWWWWRGRPKNPGVVRVALGIAATFVAVALTRIVFRADTMERAGEVVKVLLAGTPGLANVTNLVWAALGFAIVSHALPHQTWTRGGDGFFRLPAVARAVAFVGLALLIRKIGSVEAAPYIYFQF